MISSYTMPTRIVFQAKGIDTRIKSNILPSRPSFHLTGKMNVGVGCSSSSQPLLDKNGLTNLPSIH